MTGTRDCPFCDLAGRTLIWANELAVAFADGFPVSPGHTLVVPRRHAATYFEATSSERQALWHGVEAVKALLDARQPPPDGYNVGFNAGTAAGQTVMHLHIHVIPRYLGDMDDPRGGVRGVIPSRQRYGPSASPSHRVDDRDPGDPFAELASFVPGQSTHFVHSLRAAMQQADEIDIVAAFIQPSGLDPLVPYLEDALARGARVRILTGDYLRVTHPDALVRLSNLAARWPLAARLYRVGASGSFHPKAYIFARGPHGAAFVGSSNLSHTALHDGVEWNLKTTHEDAETFRAVRARFELLFGAPESVPLDAELVARYRAERPVPPPPAPEVAAPPPPPHALQVEVLARLQDARSNGARRGLVVMATGLGKTYLSAFDFERSGARRGLFVAHREEILDQAAAAWSRVLPSRTAGFLTGDRREPDVDLLFASVQTLSRHHHLRAFAPDHFDYIVIDEFHHAAAASYRKLLAHFSPRFLLGLTATPDRLDGAALLDLCDDNLIARVSLVEGITRQLLVPFRYYGVKDCIDFAPIPWRGGRFASADLTRAAATEERAGQALREYQRHAPPRGRRALVFCCSVTHADFMARYLSSHGVAAVAVHSDSTSAPRAASLQQLRDGKLEAICCVDVFNEGVDLPNVNVILMLRPTESPVIFLQQLGRGLRQAPGKSHLVVVDFIGNHRSFMTKPQALVALTGMDAPPGAALGLVRAGLELPAGCSVDIETEALDMLERVAKLSREDELVYLYANLRQSQGHRPTAAELLAAGVDLKPVRDRYSTWFDFVRAQGDLDDAEAEVLEAHRDWFSDLMRTRLSRSFKMIALEVLDAADELHGDIGVDDFARRALARLRGDPVLSADIAEHEQSGKGDAGFIARWRESPLRVFDRAQDMSRQWFALEGARFVSRLAVPEGARAVFDAMTLELVDLRLREYRQRNTFATNVLPLAAPILISVGHATGNPVLRLDRERRPDTPRGDVAVTVDGQGYVLHLADTTVVVAADRPGGPNQLPTLLRRWFGPTAGQPGTRHRVELVRGPAERWTLRPRRERAEVAPVIALDALPYYDDLRVACGDAGAQFGEHDRRTSLTVTAARKLDPARHFIVRANGNSMDGGEVPIRDGDLVLCEWTTITDAAAVAGQPVLLTGGTVDETFAYLKTIARAGGRWVLRSTNPTVPDMALEPTVTLRVVARVLEVVQERPSLALWGLYERTAIARAFGQDNNPSWRTGHRDVEVSGRPHTVLMLNLKKPAGTPIEHQYADRFVAPDELQWESQASTSLAGAKGARLQHATRDGRTIHLFVRFHTKDAEGKGEPFVYCGTVRPLRHRGERPVRFWFGLDHPLPSRLWQAWS